MNNKPKQLAILMREQGALTLQTDVALLFSTVKPSLDFDGFVGAINMQGRYCPCMISKKDPKNPAFYLWAWLDDSLQEFQLEKLPRKTERSPVFTCSIEQDLRLTLWLKPMQSGGYMLSGRITFQPADNLASQLFQAAGTGMDTRLSQSSEVIDQLASEWLAEKEVDGLDDCSSLFNELQNQAEHVDAMQLTSSLDDLSGEQLAQLANLPEYMQ